MTQPEWRWTEDPSDPCAYDVQWDESEGEDNARPCWPDGSTVPKVWSHIHSRCQEAVIAYSMGGD